MHTLLLHEGYGDGGERHAARGEHKQEGHSANVSLRRSRLLELHARHGNAVGASAAFAFAQTLAERLLRELAPLVMQGIEAESRDKAAPALAPAKAKDSQMR